VTGNHGALSAQRHPANEKSDVLNGFDYFWRQRKHRNTSLVNTAWKWHSTIRLNALPVRNGSVNSDDNRAAMLLLKLKASGQVGPGVWIIH
jgi:hypothetical protein